MTYVWVAVGLVAALSVMLRLTVPLALANRELPARVHNALSLIAPALIAALVVTMLWPSGGSAEHSQAFLTLTTFTGVAVGGGLLLWKRSILLALVAAAMVTALSRLLLG